MSTHTVLNPATAQPVTGIFAPSDQSGVVGCDSFSQGSGPSHH